MATNVKPGDLAKVVADPYNQGTLGIQVLVVKRAEAHDPYQHELKEHLERLNGGPEWECEVLEGRFIFEHHYGQRISNDIRPGEHAWVNDTVLRRIDPPSDSLELMRDEPLPGEEDLLTPETREALREFVEIEVRKMVP